MKSSEVKFRVRYCETDQMGTYSSSRALDWFEHGRTELMRDLGVSYAEIEERGLRLPVAEARVKYLGRAKYDDPLAMRVSMGMKGRARVRFDFEIVNADTGRLVCVGWTVHAVTGPSGRPVRPPEWFLELL